MQKDVPILPEVEVTRIEPLVFDYVNYEGIEKRYVGYPSSVVWKTSTWYASDGPQWYIHFEIKRDGVCLDRTFQLKRIKFV